MTRTKIPMNRDNIQELFLTNDLGLDIHNFLLQISASYSVCTVEELYHKFINLLYMNMFDEANIINAFNFYNTKYTNEYKDFLIDKIINDYNNFYLVDKFYNGYWYDENCYTDDTLTILVE